MFERFGTEPVSHRILDEKIIYYTVYVPYYSIGNIYTFSSRLAIRFSQHERRIIRLFSVLWMMIDIIVSNIKEESEKISTTVLHIKRPDAEKQYKI